MNIRADCVEVAARVHRARTARGARHIVRQVEELRYRVLWDTTTIHIAAFDEEEEKDRP